MKFLQTPLFLTFSSQISQAFNEWIEEVFEPLANCAQLGSIQLLLGFQERSLVYDQASEFELCDIFMGQNLKNCCTDDEKCGITNSSFTSRHKSFEYQIKDYVTSEDIILEIVLTFIFVLGTSGTFFLIAFCYLKGRTRQTDKALNKE